MFIYSNSVIVAKQNHEDFYSTALLVMMKAFMRMQKPSCKDKISAFMRLTCALLLNAHHCNRIRPKYRAVINTFQD